MTAVFEIAQKPYLSYLKNIRRGSPALVFQACQVVRDSFLLLPDCQARFGVRQLLQQKMG